MGNCHDHPSVVEDSTVDRLATLVLCLWSGIGHSECPIAWHDPLGSVVEIAHYESHESSEK